MSAISKLLLYSFGHRVESGGSRPVLLWWKLMRRLDVQWRSKRRMIIANKVGRFLVSCDDSLEKSSPNYESGLHRWLAFDNDGLFVDVGANVGFYTVLAMRRYGYEGAVCYEPNPRVARTLELNLAMNSPPVYRVRCVALSEDDGIARMSASVTESGKGTIRENGDFEVPTRRFDDEFTDPVSTIRFIKIDVEGHEYAVLKGMEYTLHQLERARVFVEIWSSNPNREASIRLLESAGFRLVDRVGANHLFEKGAGSGNVAKPEARGKDTAYGQERA